MINESAFARRSFLRGLGAMIALPALESMRMTAGAATAARATKAVQAPTRMAFLFVPNGMHMPDWTPQTEGAAFDLPWIMDPLKPYRDDITVLTGLTQDRGRSNGDGGGDHARSAGSWLTGAQPLKDEGTKVRVGRSIDQVAAQFLGKDTRLPSLEIGLEPGRQGGKCDTGYACVYSNNVSWRDESTPMTREINPRLVFERLFGGLGKEQDEGSSRRKMLRKSILDFVMEDAKTLSGKVSGADRHKLNEYLSAVRDIEMRIERAQNTVSGVADIANAYEIPEGIPDSFEEHARIMSDLMVLAFQTDTTRVCTFMLANEGSNRSYRNVGAKEGHHSLSHHQGDHHKQAQIREINRFHVTQLAYLLGRLRSIKEADGVPLLDRTMLLYGAGLADGNAHEHHNLPLLLAGGGNGAITPGRHVRYAPETPMCNLLLSMLQSAGVPAERFGDSTGPLRKLQA